MMKIQGFRYLMFSLLLGTLALSSCRKNDEGGCAITHLKTWKVERITLNGREEHLDYTPYEITFTNDGAQLFTEIPYDRAGEEQGVWIISDDMKFLYLYHQKGKPYKTCLLRLDCERMYWTEYFEDSKLGAQQREWVLREKGRGE